MAHNGGGKEKYSKSIFGGSKSQENKISKLVNSGTADPNKIVAEKKQYVADVVNLPEFTSAFSFVEQNAMKHGSTQDQESISLIKNKIKTGDVTYDDIDELYKVSDNVFKHGFVVAPSKVEHDGAVIWGSLFTVAAIIMRIAYLFEESNTLLVFMTLLNTVPIIYTFACYPNQIVEEISSWLDMNMLDKKITTGLLEKTIREARQIVVLAVMFVVLWLLFSWCILDDITFGNDLLAVVSLFVSIFSGKILDYWVFCYENNIYHNGRKYGG